MSNYLDITGQRFGRLIAIERHAEKYKKTKWLCKCDCGNEKLILLDTLMTGKGKSCGCLRKEITSKRRKKHGQSNSNNRIYNIWLNMRNRCNNKNDLNYKNYGGRGITVCKEWDDYSSFEKWALEHGYDDSLTIDRINVNGNYEPSNCRWATKKTQSNNTRINVKTTINGIERTLSEHSDYHGINYATLHYRYEQGLRDKELIKPLEKRKLLVTIDDETHNLKEWSKLKGINYATLQNRYKVGIRGKELFKPIDKIMSEKAKRRA